MINLKKLFTPAAPLPHRCFGGVGVLPWHRAEQRVRYFPDERLGGVEQFALSVLPKSHELLSHLERKHDFRTVFRVIEGYFLLVLFCYFFYCFLFCSVFSPEASRKFGMCFS